MRPQVPLSAEEVLVAFASAAGGFCIQIPLHKLYSIWHKQLFMCDARTFFVGRDSLTATLIGTSLEVKGIQSFWPSSSLLVSIKRSHHPSSSFVLWLHTSQQLHRFFLSYFQSSSVRLLDITCNDYTNSSWEHAQFSESLKSDDTSICSSQQWWYGHSTCQQVLWSLDTQEGVSHPTAVTA